MEEVSGKTPQALLDKPDLEEWEQDVADAFWLLSASRPVGFGSASGITTVDVLAMAAAWGFEPTWFLRVIRALDTVFLAHLAKAAARAAKAKK